MNTPKPTDVTGESITEGLTRNHMNIPDPDSLAQAIKRVMRFHNPYTPVYGSNPCLDGFLQDPSGGSLITRPDIGSTPRLCRMQQWNADDFSMQVTPEQRIGAFWANRLSSLTTAILGALDVPTFDFSRLFGGNYKEGATNLTPESIQEASSGNRGFLVITGTLHTKLRKRYLIDWQNCQEYLHGYELVVIPDSILPTPQTSYVLQHGSLLFSDETWHREIVLEEVRRPGAPTQLWHRVQWCVHPTGFWYQGPYAENTPTNEELGAKQNWRPVNPPSNGIIRIITKEA